MVLLDSFNEEPLAHFVIFKSSFAVCLGSFYVKYPLVLVLF